MSQKFRSKVLTEILRHKNGHSQKTASKLSYKMVVTDLNFYLALIGFSMYIIRRHTYIAWLGSGWPEWVAEDGDPFQYNQDINRFQSVDTLF